jgi:predicted DNA-binding protein YlxM (UPF0122 family)
MAIENMVGSQYIEDFYVKHQIPAEIARHYNVADSVVRKIVQNYNPVLYRNEMLMRSEERKRIRQESKRRVKLKRIIQEQPELCRELDFQFETQKGMGEWLDWHFRNSGIFPYKKLKGSSDADLVWTMSQSGVDNLLKGIDWNGDKLEYRVGKDVIKMIRAARRSIPYAIAEVEALSDGDLMKLGCNKRGKQGGQSGRSARMSMIK